MHIKRQVINKPFYFTEPSKQTQLYSLGQWFITMEKPTRQISFPKRIFEEDTSKMCPTCSHSDCTFYASYYLTFYSSRTSFMIQYRTITRTHKASDHALD